MRSTLQLACGVSLAAVLTACGGGSGAKPDPKPEPVALTSEQIRMYSGHSLFAGLVVQAPTLFVSMFAYEKGVGYSSEPYECEHGGTVDITYTPVSPDSSEMSPGDEIALDFKQCREEFGLYGLGLSMLDDDDGDDVITINGKAKVLLTAVPVIYTRYAKPVSAPALTSPKLAKFLAAMESATTLGTQVTYTQLQIGDGDEVDDTDTTFDGTMRLQLSVPFMDGGLGKQEAPSADTDDPVSVHLLTLTNSQRDGEALTVSFEEDGKSYSQTISRFNSQLDIDCGCDSDSLRHTLNDLQYTNEGSDPELGDNLAYSVELVEPIVINDFEFGVASGEMLTTVHLGDDYAEDVTTKFASSGDDATVDISSTGGAAWSGSFEDYLGFDFD